VFYPRSGLCLPAHLTGLGRAPAGRGVGGQGGGVLYIMGSEPVPDGGASGGGHASTVVWLRDERIRREIRGIGEANQ
jgi:hypothetical protein